MANKRDEGSILKAADGKRWNARLRYTDRTGIKREKKRTCNSYAAAKAMISTLRAEVERDLSDRKTYREADVFFRAQYVHAAKFVNGQKVSGFRQDTATVERYLDRALAFFGDRELIEITYADLRNYKREIEAMPKERKGGGRRSVSDTNHHLKRVRRLLNIAVEQGWIAVNPFEKGGSLIAETFEVERTRILSKDEELRLVAACTGIRVNPIKRFQRGKVQMFDQSINMDNPTLRAVIVFAIETGCRRGEMQSLKWRDVNLAARVITIESSNTKTMKSRLVPISARLRETLAELRQNSLRPNSLVFGGADFKRSFNTAARTAGLLDVHFHDLRHTAITRMLEAGISPPLVMKISGHTQQKTFLRYVNQSESSVYEIALKLDAAA